MLTGVNKIPHYGITIPLLNEINYGRFSAGTAMGTYSMNCKKIAALMA